MMGSVFWSLAPSGWSLFKLPLQRAQLSFFWDRGKAVSRDLSAISRRRLRRRFFFSEGYVKRGEKKPVENGKNDSFPMKPNQNL